jgi:ketosteroid isomerase-like protein
MSPASDEHAKSHEETLLRAVDAFNRRDRAALLDFCDPELVNIPPREWPESSAVTGREAVWDFYVQGNEPWEDSALSVVELVDASDDKVVAHIRGEMRGRVSGAGVPWSFWGVVTFRNGKVAHVEWFADRAEALGRARDPLHG